MELSRPFAENGDRIDFPEDAQGDGDLSLEQGFGPRFALPPEESGLFIDRQKYNQLMYLVTKGVIDAKEAVKLMQQEIDAAEEKINTELAKLTEFETKLSGFTSRLDSLEDEVANIDESLIGGKVVTLVDKDIFITVGNPGSGAQFEKLEDALYEGMKYRPINNHYVFVVLKTNLTIDYSLLFFGMDMSHIIITGWFDGTQGQVRPPIHKCKRIYFDVMGACRRQKEGGFFYHKNKGFTALFITYYCSTWLYSGVVFSHKEQLPDLSVIKSEFPMFNQSLDYSFFPFCFANSTTVNFSTVDCMEINNRLKDVYNVNSDILETDIINDYISIHNLVVFRSIGVRTTVFLAYESYVHAYHLYLENASIIGGAVSVVDNSNCIHNQTTNLGLMDLLVNSGSECDYRFTTHIFRTGSKLTNLFVVAQSNMWFYPYYACMGDTTAFTNICNIASNTITPQGIFFETQNATTWRNNPKPYPEILDTYFPLHQSGWTEADHNPNVNLPLASEKKKVTTELEVVTLGGVHDYTKIPYEMDSREFNMFPIGIRTTPFCAPPVDFYAEALNPDVASCSSLEGNGQYLSITAKKAGTATFRIHAQANSANTDTIEYTETVKEVTVTIIGEAFKPVVDLTIDGLYYDETKGFYYPEEFYLCLIKRWLNHEILGQASLDTPLQDIDVWATTYEKWLEYFEQAEKNVTTFYRMRDLELGASVVSLRFFWGYDREKINTWLKQYEAIIWSKQWHNEMVEKAVNGKPYDKFHIN